MEVGKEIRARHTKIERQDFFECSLPTESILDITRQTILSQLLLRLEYLMDLTNITDNGFYNNTERMTLTLKNESGFEGARTTTWDIWYEGNTAII